MIIGLLTADYSLTYRSHRLFSLWQWRNLAGCYVRARGHVGKARLAAWSPCRQDSLRCAAELDLDILNVGVPVSPRHLEKRLGWSALQLLKRLETLPRQARELGLISLSVGFEDATSADPGFVVQAAALAVDAGASRIRLADTLGQASPVAMAQLVAAVRCKVKTPLAVHCHNDLGMATANALSALDAGATHADCSLLGLGERAGIAATEELAAWLACYRQADYDLKVLREGCGITAREADLAVSRCKPVVGSDLFCCESGLHVHGLGLDPELYEPYPPEAVGGERRLGIGGKSGRAAVRQALQAMGLDEPPAGLGALTQEVRLASRRKGRPLDQAELLALYATLPRTA